jgi:glycosyltransferase involved in cell wall biosynthesis
MKIAIFIGELQPNQSGGSATFEQSIIKEISSLNSKHKFFIFYLSEIDLLDKLKNNISNDEINFINLFSNKVKNSLDLNQELVSRKIDLIWFVSPREEVKNIKIPFIVTIWDLQHRLQSFFPEVSISGWTFDQRESFYQSIIPKASYIIIGNQEGAKQINQFYNYPFERIKTVAMPTPSYVYDLEPNNKILEKYQLKKDQYLFYPAQFWPHKNHIALLDALKIIKENNLNFDLVFTGSDKGNQKYIKQKVKEFSLENEVKFLGFVGRDEIVGLYQNAFCLVFPSMFGPDNIPPLEAMALSCPVICSNSKGMEEQLRDCALFFNPLNPKEIVDQIIKIKNDNSLKLQMVEKGKILAKSVDSKNYIKNVMKIIDEFEPKRRMWSSDEIYVHL